MTVFPTANAGLGFIVIGWGVLRPTGEIRLHVQASYRFVSPCAALMMCAGALFVAGCHRSPGPDVVATVNGKEITRAELERKYLATTITMGNQPQSVSAEQGDMVRLNVLRQAIDDEILQQRAAKLSVAVTDDEINAKVNEFKSQFSGEAFEQELKQRNETLDDLKRDIRHALTQQKLFNKEIESKISVTSGTIADYYNSHKADFNLIEPQYNLAQIVVTNAPAQQAGNLQNNKASGEADARKKIQALRNKLENGEDFGQLAQNYSENPNTASNGGDMGFVAESALHGDAAVYAAISKLKPGQISETLPMYDNGGPQRHVIGYVIFKLLGHEPAGQRGLNDPRVQQSIRNLLHDGHAQLLKSAYLEMIHNDAKVHNYLADQVLKQGAN